MEPTTVLIPVGPNLDDQRAIASLGSLGTARHADLLKLLIVVHPDSKHLVELVRANGLHEQFGSLEFLHTPSKLAAALNEGLAATKTRLVARFDIDDETRPHRFEQQWAAFGRHPETDILGGWARGVSSTGERIEIRKPRRQDVQRYAVRMCPIIHPTVMMKVAPVLALGGYDVRREGIEDYDLWVRALKAGLVMDNLQEPLIEYNVDNSLENRRGSFRYAWENVRVRLKVAQGVRQQCEALAFGVSKALPSRWYRSAYRHAQKNQGRVFVRSK